MCMADSEVLQFYPTHQNTMVLYNMWIAAAYMEVTFLIIVGWNIILLNQTKGKSQQEGQEGPKSLTGVSWYHCSNCLCCRNSVWVCMRFHQYNIGHHLPCKIIWGKWFWERRFKYFPLYFYGSNAGHPEEDQYWTRGHYLNKQWLGSKGCTAYLILDSCQSLAVLEKKTFQ